MKKSSAIPRWWDWPAIVLLFILLQILASRLVNTSWTPFLYLAQTFAGIGLVIGLALGYSQFHRGTARWLSFFYVLVLTPLLWTLVIDQRVSLEEQLSSVGGRLFFSITELIARRPVDDPFFFVAVMTITFWVISSLPVFPHAIKITEAIAIAIELCFNNMTCVPDIWALASRSYFSCSDDCFYKTRYPGKRDASSSPLKTVSTWLAEWRSWQA
jgi:hypothetical protein